MRVSAFVAGVLLLPALAGCVGPAEADAEWDASTHGLGSGAFLRIVVYDEEFYPIPSADLFLLELARNATTDRWGEATFDHVPPGVWTLHGEGRGFLPNRLELEVEPETSAMVQLALRHRAPDLYLVDYRREVGFCGVGVRQAPVSPDGACQQVPYLPRPTVTFPMEKGLTWAVVQVEWRPQSPLTETMRFEVRIIDDTVFADGSPWLWLEGQSPLTLRITSDMITPPMQESGHWLQVTAHAGDGVVPAAVGQLFDVFAELGFFKPAERPDGSTRGG